MSTANANRLHQRWTRQLLRGSTLLPRPSMLKLFSLPVASGASFRLALGPHPPPTMRSCFIGTGRGGVIAREIITSHVQAPSPFCSEAKVAKGGGGGAGVFAGHYGTYTYHYIIIVCVLPRGWYICTRVFSMWRGGICMYVSYLCSTLDVHTLHIG